MKRHNKHDRVAEVLRVAGEGFDLCVGGSTGSIDALVALLRQVPEHTSWRSVRAEYDQTPYPSMVTTSGVPCGPLVTQDLPEIVVPDLELKTPSAGGS